MIKKTNCPYCDTKIGIPSHIEFITTVRCTACHGYFHFDVNTDKATPKDVRNYYEILGLEPEVRDDLIKQRFRELMKRFHPDHNPHQSEKAAALTKRISEAYSVLGSPADRASYNLKIAAELPAGPGTSVSGSSVDAEPEGSRARTWGWVIVVLILVVLYYAHHGVPIGLRSFGDYYTDKITLYNAPIIIRYLRDKNNRTAQVIPAAAPVPVTSLTAGETKR